MFRRRGWPKAVLPMMRQPPERVGRGWGDAGNAYESHARKVITFHLGFIVHFGPAISDSQVSLHSVEDL